MPSRSSSRNRFAAVALLAVLAGCADVPAPPAETLAAAPLAGIEAIRGFDLSGRIAVKYDGLGFSGSLRWSHDARRDDILLLSPLGQGVARIVRDADGVTLTSADETPHRAASVEELTQAFLGWRLPIHGLEHWALGLPAPETGWRGENGANGRPERLYQDGWKVDYERYRTVQGVELPGRLEAAYGNTLEIRLVIDRWSLQ
ncbi:MAG: outer membrane lipoprotein LolB [Sulfuricella sp.]|nr:outer membrane lipoprotein LolB [Sulfuricella sp.]